MSESVVILIAIGLIVFAVSRPRQFLFYTALLMNLPIVIHLRLLLFAIQRVSAYNVQQLEQGRYTLWMKVSSKLRIKIISLDDLLVSSIVWFLGDEGKEMIKISKVKETVEYVPVSERGDDVENPASIVMKRLTRARLAQIQDGLFGLNKNGGVSKIRSGTVRLQIVRESIVSLNNFSYDGQPLVFDPSNRDELYELLPPEIAEELEIRFGDGKLDPDAVEEKLAKAKAEAEADSEADEEESEDAEAAA